MLTPKPTDQHHPPVAIGESGDESEDTFAKSVERRLSFYAKRSTGFLREV